MDPALRAQVRRRAGDRCEYCRLSQTYTSLPHEVDHIRSRKHRGLTNLDNLSWACARCNSFKGTDVSAYDPLSGELVPLFNPRIDIWTEHFEWHGSSLAGRTKTGRATMELLQINLPERLEHRRLLMEIGVFRT